MHRSASLNRIDGRETPVLDAVVTALASGDASALREVTVDDPIDDRDAFAVLLEIYDLWTAPLSELGGTEVFQNHPEVARLKAHLESSFLSHLDERCPATEVDPVDAVPAMRRIATSDLVPPVYEWLADRASWDQLVRYLALEGGPDGGFDDLVAIAQVGIGGDPKVAMAANYWDELGRGTLVDVHTELHHRLVQAVDMPRVPRTEQPVEALERSALNGLLATNRYLQPEMIGALGLLEMQAGPRCRAVVRALRRLDAPTDSFPFYEEHAQADPRHGKDWLERVVAPLAQDPTWATRIVRGARWRSDINERFFAAAHEDCSNLRTAMADVKVA